MAVDVKIVATVDSIGDVIEYGDNKRKQIVIAVTSKNGYKDYYAIEFHNQKIEEFVNTLRIGDSVRFRCNLNGREWESPSGENKYFLTLFCWGCKDSSIPETTQKTAPDVVNNSTAPTYKPKIKAQANMYDELLKDSDQKEIRNPNDDDDLPF